MSQEQYVEELIKQTEEYVNAKEKLKENIWQSTVDRMVTMADDYSMDQVELLDDIAKMFLDKVNQLKNNMQ